MRLLIVLAYTVVKLPFSLRMIKAAFYSIDTELEDAARNIGASGLRTFLKVKLPIILPSVLAVFALIRREVLNTVEWVRMDRGTISDDDALARMQARLPRHLHGTAEYLVRRWNDPIVPVEGMADVARDLKNAGYDLYLLSNASTRQHTYWHDIPGNEYFSGTFISADYRLLKPEDAIYQAFFRKFGLKPEDCLFIDDSPANIEASENAGMAGIVFHGDAAHLRCQLADRGIL